MNVSIKKLNCITVQVLHISFINKPVNKIPNPRTIMKYNIGVSGRVIIIHLILSAAYNRFASDKSISYDKGIQTTFCPLLPNATIILPNDHKVSAICGVIQLL